MAGKRYSAGAIFLQVVPVFANVQRAIEDEAKNIDRALGGQMERSGEEAGRKAGKAMAKGLVAEADSAGEKAAEKYAGHFETQVKSAVKAAQKELDALNGDKFTTISEKAIKDLEKVQKKLNALKDTDFSVDFDAAKTLAEIKALESAVTDLTKGDHEINLHANLRQVQKQLAQVSAMAEAVAKDKHEIRFGVQTDLKQAERELGAFEKKFRNSIKSASASLGDSVSARAKQVRSELDALGDVEINIDLDAGEAIAQAGAIQAFLSSMLSDETLNIDVRHDIESAVDSLKKFRDEFVAVQEEVVATERRLGVFERNFKRTAASAADKLDGSLNEKLRDLGAELKHLENLRIGTDISSSRALAELTEIQVALEKLDREDIDIDARVDIASALAELATLAAFIDKIENDDIDIDVDVDSDGLSKARRNADDAANSFRSFNIILLAAVSVGPALIPILAGIAGGLAALGPAAAVGAAGLGSVLIGFSGLGDALTALGNQQDQAATNAQTSANRQVSAARAIENAQDALADARRNAARAAEDAADRVADAREAAADAIEDALERQKEAQEEYRDAVQDVKDAEDDLRDARAEAEKDAASLAKRQRQNAVDERQALLDLAEAQNEFNNTMADGSATNTDKEQASVNLEQAQIRLNDIRDEQVALTEEAADYAKNGVEGNEDVKSAQERLTDALEAQKDAQEAVKDAAEAADEARVEGAERVREALEDQRETLSDNARAIQRAKEAVADARQSAVQDLQQIDAQAQAVEAAFDKLGPAGRKFALFLFSLRSGFYEFRDAIQTAMLPAIQQAIEGFIGSSNASKAKDAMVALAGGFGQFIQQLSRSFQGPAWAAFFEMLATTGVQIQKAYGTAFIKIMEAFANILVTTAPFALRFAEGLAKMMNAFADWAGSKAGQEAITGFLDHVEEIGPKVLAFFGGLAGAFVNVVKAMSPYADVVLGIVDNFLNFIAQMDTGTLGAILTGLTVILLASQVAYGIMNLMMAGSALFATAVGPWIFLIIGLGAALVYLYKTNEDFAKFIDKAWDKISKIWDAAWKKYIKPALEELWTALKDLWDEVLAPFFAWLGPILVWAIERMLPNLLIMFATVVKAIARFIQNTVIPALKKFGEWMQWLWGKAKDLKDELQRQWAAVKSDAKALKEGVVWFFKRIAAGWQSFADDMQAIYDDYIQPIWDYIVDEALPALKRGFDTVISEIGDLWEGLKALVGTPIKFVIEKVINGGLIDGFNSISKKVNGPTIDHVAVPKWMQSYATGGIMPGYTPGRDPHKFISPTGGRLELSGGEAVMRPEWTKAMGSDYVYRMNTLARRGGVKAVREAAMGLGGYWMGGVLPLPGGSVSSHGSSYGHPAFDLNYPGYADYGKPVKAWRSGTVAQKNYIGDASYGRWVVLNHPGSQSSLYAHLSNFAKIAVGQAIAAGQTIGYVGDLGNTGTPPTSHLHFEIQGGNVDYSDNSGGAVGTTDAPAMPGWMSSLISKPIAWAKGLISKPIEALKEKFAGNEMLGTIARFPIKLAKAVGKYAKDVLPKAFNGAADKLLGNRDSDDTPVAPGPESGLPGGGDSAADMALARGGILPYNGTMMYDSGGYLPPGLTTVVNLTGKPEPVFTDEQWSNVSGGFQSEDGFTYAPTFQGTDLTPADIVDDLDFARRKMRREGRYSRSKL